jgi:hypothetical protein
MPDIDTMTDVQLLWLLAGFLLTFDVAFMLTKTRDSER